MTKRSGWTLSVAMLALLVGPAASAQDPNECLVGPGAAATLLYPYFVVDLDDVNGVTTLISINNASAIEALTRVTVWTDFGIPVLAFDVYLAGLDVQTINLRSILEGNIPSTGAEVDLGAFQFCDFLPPSHANPILTAAEIAQLRADHTGVQGPTFSDCTGASYGDNMARGYVTVDVVDECSGVESGEPFFTPENTTGDPSYFDDGSGVFVAVNDNILWGDVVYVDFTGNAAQGSEAVALYADTTQFAGPDIFTFYGRFSSWDGRDHRVPLPAVWNQRYLNGGPFAGGADLTVWRDPGIQTVPQSCGVTPTPFPLSDLTFFFNEDSVFQAAGGSSNFPYATQRVSIGDLNSPFDFGWLQIDAGSSQMWVQPTLQASGRFSAALNGTPVIFLCNEVPTPTP